MRMTAALCPKLKECLLAKQTVMLSLFRTIMPTMSGCWQTHLRASQYTWVKGHFEFIRHQRIIEIRK
ncbi:hypothetical protein DSECCO2_565800 [anaerobic digester metagenome]